MTTTATAPARTAEYWEGIAQSCLIKAQELLNSGTSKQNPTRRRMQIVESQRDEAKRLHEDAEACVAIAWAMREKKLPYGLAKLKYRSDVSALLVSLKHGKPYQPQQLERAGIDQDQIMNVAGLLKDLIGRYTREIAATPGTNAIAEAKKEQDKSEQLVELKKLGMQDIPGFFPTPPSIAATVISAADFGPDVKTILEPSCGAGCLLIEATKAARAAGADPQVFGIEINREAANLASRRTAGDPMIQIHNVDFTSNPVDERSVDLVVMNPPFENGQDIQHVARAFQWLKPGGRLVAIICNGPFFRMDARSVKFREWLRVLGAWNTVLPADAFDRHDAVRRTGVRTQLLVIDRPMGT